MSWGETKLFLSKVVAWPTDGFGYVNLHYSMTAQDDPTRKIVTGKPFNSLDSLIGFAQWAEGHAAFKDIWFCTSLQKMDAKTSGGKPKALRLSANARFLKALWIDIDIGNEPSKPDKHYDTVEQAWVELDNFITATGLPPISACVKSGGGLHVYWISDTNLTPEDWRPYAEGLRALLVKHGLKCDSGLTTDNVRLLRVPETSNHKYDPPRKVELMQLPLTEINFASQLSFLTAIAPLAVQAHRAAALPGQYFDPALFPKQQMLAGPVESLAEGIDKYDGAHALLDPTAVVKGCKFIFNALKEGGRDYDNPLWNLTTLCATFMENGEALAHKMSKDHAGYKVEDTQALYERKLADRTSRNLGWPACSTIEANGCKDCATCPFRMSNKSPLNLAKPKPVTGTVIGTTLFSTVAAPSNALPTGAWLPDGYVLDHLGRVCYLEPQKPDKNGVPAPPIPKLLFYTVLSMPWAQKDPDVIHFHATFDKGNSIMTHIRHEDMVGQGLTKALAHARIKPCVENQNRCEGFLMALLDKLHREREAQESRPLGWYMEDGKRAGFVYGGVVTDNNGNSVPSGVSDNEMTKRYTPVGDFSYWKAACDTITSIGRPEFDALIAIAFASPLMPVLGTNGMMLSAWGESGTGKTAASLVGLAVWGHPLTTKEGKKTTQNSLLNKLGQTRNLPAYWDEITDESAQKHCLDTIFDLTGGVEKGRMKVSGGDVQQRERGLWQCLMAMSANLSMVEYIIQKNPTHEGGINRIFEYEVGPNDPAKLISTTEANRIIDRLQYNYGAMGAVYSRFLAMNAAAIDTELHDVGVQVEKDLGATQAERNWASLIAALICGAKYANMCGASLNEAALKPFLYDVFVKNRERRAGENMTGGTVSNTESTLSAYLKQRLSTGTIWTNAMHVGKGRAPLANVIQGPEIGRAATTAIQVRFDLRHRQMIISRQDLIDWIVANHKGSSTNVLDALKKHYGATRERRSLAAGTRYAVTQESVLVINVGPKSAFREMMEMNGVGSGGATLDEADVAADTGLVEGASETAADVKEREEAGREIVEQATKQDVL